jgi:uncharacterized phage protein gp47/JayE
VGDFGLTRDPAIQATGLVTFSRWVGAGEAIIQAGLLLKTQDLSQTFTVIQDTTNDYWSDSQGAYVAPIGITSITVPVQAVNAGVQGNVQAGMITIISGDNGGFNQGVTNPLAFTNGVDPESDDNLKRRFPSFLNTLRAGTEAAVENAIAGVQGNLRYMVLENTDPTGAARAGFFTVYVDDQTGAPPAPLLAQVTTAINAVRALGVQFSVQPCSVSHVSVAVTIYAASGYDKTALIPQVVTAITDYIASVGMGEAVSYFNIAAAAKNVEGVAKIEGLTLNGGAEDVGGIVGGVVLPNPGGIVVS